MEPSPSCLVRKYRQESDMQNFPTQPASPDIGLGIRNVSRSGNYDRPAREGRGDALFGDPGSSPGDQDPQTGRAKPNSSAAGSGAR